MLGLLAAVSTGADAIVLTSRRMVPDQGRGIPAQPTQLWHGTRASRTLQPQVAKAIRPRTAAQARNQIAQQRSTAIAPPRKANARKVSQVVIATSIAARTRASPLGCFAPGAAASNRAGGALTNWSRDVRTSRASRR